MGYNPAIIAKGVTKEDVKRIQGPNSRNSYQLESEKFGSAEKAQKKPVQARISCSGGKYGMDKKGNVRLDSCVVMSASNCMNF